MNESMLNLLDKVSKSKVETMDNKFLHLSKKVHLFTGPIFHAWNLAEDKDKEVAKYCKKAVLLLGQLQLALNNERRQLAYGEICKDQAKLKAHLKEASDAFGKVAKKTESPPLFGDKFQRGVIKRGTLSKQLKETRLRGAVLVLVNPEVGPLMCLRCRGSILRRPRAIRASHLPLTLRVNSSPFRGTPPELPLGGVVVEGTYALQVKLDMANCTSITLGQQEPRGLCGVHELTTLFSSLQEEFLKMTTPTEFVELELMSTLAPDKVGGQVSFFLGNWAKVTSDPWVLSVMRNGYQVEWLQKPV